MTGSAQRKQYKPAPPRRLTLQEYDPALGRYAHVTDPERIAHFHNNIRLPPWGRVLLKTARVRAAKLGMPFTLTALDLKFLIEKSRGKCAITGIPFEDTPSKQYSRRPFAASLDRIRSDRGYTPGTSAPCASR